MRLLYLIVTLACAAALPATAQDFPNRSIHIIAPFGPGTATETLTAYAGTIYFKNADFPYASTIALFTLILVVVTSSVFIKIFKVKF